MEEDFLESLSKYETFDLIRQLDISKKNIKEIKVLPKKLIELNCSKNQLTKLFADGCNIPETLVRINCSYNKITHFPDKNLLQNLKHLNCSYNKLKCLDYPESLEEINMDNNKISGKLLFKPNIKILSANNNLISGFEYTEIPIYAKELYLNNNKITYFPSISGPVNRLIFELKSNPIIKNDSDGRYLFNTIFEDPDPYYELKLKLNIL